MSEPDAWVVHRLLDARCVDALALMGDERVLDVGCGFGELSQAIALRCRRVVAIDRDPEIVAAARESRRAANLEFRVGDAQSVPLGPAEPGSFDVVHMRFVLESTRDQAALIRRALPALRPGGRMVLADDDHEVLRLWPPVPSFDPVWSGYLSAFDAAGNDSIAGRRLVELLASAGFSPVRAQSLSFGVSAGEPGFGAAVARLRAILMEWRPAILESGLVAAHDHRAAIESLDEFGRHPGAAIWYVLRWAEGVRSDGIVDVDPGASRSPEEIR